MKFRVHKDPQWKGAPMAGAEYSREDRAWLVEIGSLIDLLELSRVQQEPVAVQEPGYGSRDTKPRLIFMSEMRERIENGEPV